MPQADIPPELVTAIAAAVREAVTPSLLVDHDGGARLLGLSRSAWYRLVGSTGFPAAVDLPGVGPRWRRSDLERWAGRLGARRGKRRRAEVAS